MTEPDRNVLFSNETLLIGMFQAVAGGSIVAALAQTDVLMDLAGDFAFRAFLTVMTVALLSAVFAAYWKHQYKRWDGKAATSRAQGRNEEAATRAFRANVYLRALRVALLVSLLAITVGLVGLVISLWYGDTPPPDDDDTPVVYRLKV